MAHPRGAPPVRRMAQELQAKQFFRRWSAAEYLWSLGRDTLDIAQALHLPEHEICNAWLNRRKAVKEFSYA